MTMVTTWWQALNARKTRLAELEVQLRNERYLRDEALRRTAMLELAYTLRRFGTAILDAGSQHKHNGKYRSQSYLPIMVKLEEIGKAYLDLLDKHAYLIDEDMRGKLEEARDSWECIYVLNEHYSQNMPERVSEKCCLLGGDFEILGIEVDQGLDLLERKLVRQHPIAS